MATHKTHYSDRYELGGGGRFVYLHFGQETPEEAEKRRALLRRAAESVGICLETEEVTTTRCRAPAKHRG